MVIIHTIKVDRRRAYFLHSKVYTHSRMQKYFSCSWKLCINIYFWESSSYKLFRRFFIYVWLRDAEILTNYIYTYVCSACYVTPFINPDTL